jgi:hypothetical protein
MIGRKKTFDDCPNTVMSQRNIGNSNSHTELSFSCPRIPEVAKFRETHWGSSTACIESTREQLAVAMGNMCTKCAFRGEPYSHTAETVITIAGAALETVTWLPVELGAKPQATHIQQENN